MIFDPDAEKMFLAARAAGLPRFETLTPLAARELLRQLRAKIAAEPQPVGSVRDITCPGEAGPVPLRVYRPAAGEAALPALVYCHGGGFVVGNLDTHDAICRALAMAAGVVVVSVDYRLAPEHPFPAGLDDTRAALRFVAAEAAALGVDATLLAVGGDSAGANLAAVMALEARDGALPALRLQLLACPVFDLSLTRASHALDMDGLAVNGSTMRWFRDHYLGADGDPADWRASPLAASSLEGAAPCHLITAGIDPLRDEGLAYAARLAASGVRLVHEHFPGQMHGFVTAGLATPTGQRALASMAASLRAALFV
jgi:acetyl esterase